jgi:DNA modification methylase
METNKIYYGNAIELCKGIPDNFVDLVVTSPPYADTVSYGKKVSTLSPDNYADWILPLFKESARFLKPTGSFILNINDRVVNGERSIYVFDLICRIARETDLKLHDRYIWAKKSGLPSGNARNRLDDKLEYIFHFVRDGKQIQTFVDEVREPYKEISLKRMASAPVSVHDTVDEHGVTKLNTKRVQPNPKGKIPTTVFRFNTAGVLKGEKSAAGKHPAPFNPEMPTWFIKYLTKSGDVVLDPFMGSGTTAAVCKQMERQYVGFELNEAYKEFIEKRLGAV